MGKRIEHPLVSVIVPTYNRANDLRRCLDSLTKQTISDFEVLICDDGSTDKTPEVAQEYSPVLDITYDYAENFGGPARPRNRGINLARASYVAFLDSDDWWEPAKLEKSVQYLDAGADIVFHDMWNVLDENQKDFADLIRSVQPIAPVFVDLLCSAVSIPNSSVVARTDLIRKIGGVCEDKQLVAVEDWDTWVRLSQITDKFVRIPECLGYYWNGGGNISSASPKQIMRTRAAYMRHMEKLDGINRRRAEAMLAYRLGRIAQLHGDWKVATQNLKQAIRGKLHIKYKAKALWLLTLGRL